MRRLDDERDPVWGPMSHPARDSIEDGAPPWKDHVYLAFWDTADDTYGYFHWNSSPNHDTTKAQVCVQIGDERFDHKEPLPPSATRFESDSFDFDLGSSIKLDAGRLTGELELAPRFRPVDYGTGDLLPVLDQGEPLEHWQQGLTMKGELSLDDATRTVDALGMRTRTWGHRDDSNQFPEYVSVFACCEHFDLTSMKFMQADGSLAADGGYVSDSESLRTTDLHVVRNSAGLPLRVDVDLEDGRRVPLRWTGVAAEFWCPIGLPERKGPTFAAYDQWMHLDVDGEVAAGLSEQAIIRRVY